MLVDKTPHPLVFFFL
uniref:Uncharacterized protein n=1 Tax=Rhizophora mucronata TaxID=61149 RepID=A0A2P2IV28_RHIMU